MSQADQFTANRPPTAAGAEAAVAAVNSLPEAVATDVVGTAVRNLTPPARRAAVMAVVHTLPMTATPDLVGSVVGQLDPATGRQAATAALNALSAQDRETAAAGVLGNPDPKTQRTLWLLVIGTMSGAVFLFGALTVVLLVLGKSADAPLALATTALGGIVGLVVTSPVGRQGGR